MLQIVQAVAFVAVIIAVFIAGPAAIARRIESNRRRAAQEAVEAFHQNPTQVFFAPASVAVPAAPEPTVLVPVVPPPSRTEDPIFAALRRREELTRGNLDRIWADFIEGLGWKGTQAARALLVGSGELPIAALTG